MNETRKILNELTSGKISIDEAEKKLKTLSLERVSGIATIDVNRRTRSGIPEVVFAESKDAEDIATIVQEMLGSQDVVLVTRLQQEKLDYLFKKLKDVEIQIYGKSPVLTVLVSKPSWHIEKEQGKIAIVTAGTSDIPFAKEAEALARMLGVEVFCYYDVGVSGIHRLFEPIKEIISNDIDAVIVFAGMEGALPTVVAALIDIPVIGVPVPTGYGFGGMGKTALASMLQSCSPGLAVVNIGNGLGAASVASLIAIRAARLRC
ncbi:nickel pincer cofactor biosynthesis protein LarB [Candidatus Thorarchaeota archaeon]|nr:MAG: nickel pincer cofactor biosynthesis protein LarB [Candidatus Thorarchaeota archaeon]